MGKNISLSHQLSKGIHVPSLNFHYQLLSSNLTAKDFGIPERTLFNILNCKEEWYEPEPRTYGRLLEAIQLGYMERIRRTGIPQEIPSTLGEYTGCVLSKIKGPGNIDNPKERDAAG